jgi:uncharacterized BrkB/YihY/UPF0761 family membrane protein
MSRKSDLYGRDAQRPYHIPLRGWWQVAQRVWSESSRDNLSVVAAGCAFYAFFGIFPALSALISLYGLTADPSTVPDDISLSPYDGFAVISGASLPRTASVQIGHKDRFEELFEYPNP